MTFVSTSLIISFETALISSRYAVFNLGLNIPSRFIVVNSLLPECCPLSNT